MTEWSKDQLLARLIYEAAQQVGWASGAQTVVERVRRLALGLPAEDELSVVLGWLGRCRLVHKLDQLQCPQHSDTQYHIPDLIAIFDYGNRRIPVLVEVKSTDDSTLSWRPDYRDGLYAYADALGLPLLVAWRHKTFWTLFDVAQLHRANRNFNIRFIDAIKQTLMGELAGDFSFSLREGVGMHIEMRKLSETSNGFDAIIENAYWTDGEGHQFKQAPGVFPLFMCLDQKSIVVEEGDMVRQSFMSLRENSQFAHRALVTLLKFSVQSDEIHWRRILEENRADRIVEGGLKAAAQQALEAGFLQYGFNIRPQVMPAFLTTGLKGE